MIRTAAVLGTTVALLGAAPVLAQSNPAATPPAGGMQHHGAKADMNRQSAAGMKHFNVLGADGSSRGMVMLQDTPNGVLITTDLNGLPPGEHGFHFHEKGLCEPQQKFTTAGAHFVAGGDKHGLMVTKSPHGGDMPNQTVGADGRLKTQVLNTAVTLGAGPRSLADADGSSLMIHAKPDDYKSQPSGDAGDRIACAVVAAPKK